MFVQLSIVFIGSGLLWDEKRWKKDNFISWETIFGVSYFLIPLELCPNISYHTHQATFPKHLRYVSCNPLPPTTLHLNPSYPGPFTFFFFFNFHCVHFLLLQCIFICLTMSLPGFRMSAPERQGLGSMVGSLALSTFVQWMNDWTFTVEVPIQHFPKGQLLILSLKLRPPWSKAAQSCASGSPVISIYQASER